MIPDEGCRDGVSGPATAPAHRAGMSGSTVPPRLPFSNEEVDVGALPDVDAVAWQPVDPAYAPRLVLSRAARLAWLLPATAGLNYLLWKEGLLTWLPSGALVAAWIVVGLWAVRSLLWPMVSVPYMGYALRDRDILYKSGVLWRNVVALPFNRVQHATTGSGPLDRRFGLAYLGVFTAGGGGGNIIEGLAADVAERLRAHIVDKLRTESATPEPEQRG